MITAGVDIGSTTSKAVILKEDNILGQVVQPSRILPSESAREVFEKCCAASGIESSQVTAVAVTGYGRRLAKFGDLVITEIRACGLGAKESRNNNLNKTFFCDIIFHGKIRVS